VTVRVGIVGVGNIGQDHIRRLARTLRGARVVALSDADSARADAVAQRVPGARVHATGEDLIRQDDVDAILVATSAPNHETFVLGAIAEGKPVFCEKPLAPTTEACRRILDAEVAGGRRLVQVGFMRRYDAGYRAMKETLAAGTLGATLFVHCAHRNPAAPPGFTSDMLVTDAAIHEIDLVRWLLDQEIVAAQVLRPRRTRRAGADLHDPQVVILESAEGTLVDVEVLINSVYGYDIRCEVVGELGSVSLADGGDVVVRYGGQRSSRVAGDWRERFGRAYDAELQAWLDSVELAEAGGPSSWDGYAATAVAGAALASARTEQRTPVRLEDRPAFYAPTETKAPAARESR